MPWFLTPAYFIGFKHIGALKIRHSMYIFCLKYIYKGPYYILTQYLLPNDMMLKNHICPIKIGITER